MRGKYKRKRERRQMLANLPLSELALGTKIENILSGAGIASVSALAAKSGAELLALPGLGEASLKSIVEKLSAHGLALKQ
ncbi:MAG: hypothetical protein IJU78_01170 [Clostridia bacterium]|nr:hypothetical protein [Clostridia bacterium]